MSSDVYLFSSSGPGDEVAKQRRAAAKAKVKVRVNFLPPAKQKATKRNATKTTSKLVIY